MHLDYLTYPTYPWRMLYNIASISHSEEWCKFFDSKIVPYYGSYGSTAQALEALHEHLKGQLEEDCTWRFAQKTTIDHGTRIADRVVM